MVEPVLGVRQVPVVVPPGEVSVVGLPAGGEVGEVVVVVGRKTPEQRGRLWGHSLDY